MILSWVSGFFADVWYAAFLAGGVVLFLAALFGKPIAGVLSGGASFALSPLLGAMQAIGKGLGVAAAIYGGWGIAMLHHDKALEATWRSAQEKAVSAALVVERERGDRATIAAADAARASALADAPVREIIRRVPVQVACAASPSVAAALGGLRQPAAGPGAGAAPHRIP